MIAIWVVATNTFRQTVRQRLFLNVAIFGVGMLWFSMMVGNLTFGYPERVVRSIGLSGVQIALNLMAMLVSVSLIHQEIDKKTLFVVLTRPLHRWQYLVGRYLGLVGTLATALLAFMVVFGITMGSVNSSPTAQDFMALFAALPEASIIAGFGIVLSSFSTPTLSAGLALGFWLSSATTDDLVRLTAKAEPMVKSTTQVIYYVLPSLERLNFRSFAVYQKLIPLDDYWGAMGYGFVYAAALVALAAAILSRREMV